MTASAVAHSPEAGGTVAALAAVPSGNSIGSPEIACAGLVDGKALSESSEPVVVVTTAGEIGPEARFSFFTLLKFAGAGIMASVAFLDPGNLEADIRVGITAQYSLLWWFAICVLVFGFAFQSLSGKVGLVTGRDLAYNIGLKYPPAARILLYALLEMSLIAADIQETVGCALAVQILSNGAIPLWAGCIIVSVAAFAMLQLDRFGFRKLEAAYAALILLEAVALGIACFSLGTPASEVMKGFIPKLSSSTIVVAAGALGALVMPYNTFFQSHVINARPRDADTPSKKNVAVTYMKIETMTILAFSFAVNVFAVVLFAQFHDDPRYEDAGLQSAGFMILERYGKIIQLMWAVGLLASGLVATLCLTYAGQIIMVGLLQIEVQATWRLMATRLISLLPCITLAVVFEATNTFDRVAQIINVVQSLCLPFGLIPLVQVSGDEKVMGAFTNKGWVKVGVSTIVLSVVGVNMYTLASLMMDQLPNNPGVQVGFSFVIALYFGLVAYFAGGPVEWPARLRVWKSKGLVLYQWLKTNRRWADIEAMLEVHF